jgi:hypothetical protein
MLSGSPPSHAEEHPEPRPVQIAAVPTPARVDDAELDQLRAELVRELDGRAARDGGGSATFRRVA